MKVAIFDTHQFERDYLAKAAFQNHELLFLDVRLNERTAILAQDCQAVCLFVNDDGSRPVLQLLHESGIQYLALRSAGYNHIDLIAAKELGLKVANVPEYSPYSVAEHTIAMILALNRKIVRASHRISELNFSLNGLVGFELHGKTVGVVGVGRIGAVVAKILHGFGCRILAFDPRESSELQEHFSVNYTDLETLCHESDIITLHAPLLESTRHIINAERIASMKPGVMLINTSRGGLVDTRAVITYLKNRHIGYLGLDVYEEEAGIFFEDHSAEDLLEDEVITRLMSFKNVLITSHQAFLTSTALRNIAETTMENLSCWEKGVTCVNELVSGTIDEVLSRHLRR